MNKYPKSIGKNTQRYKMEVDFAFSWRLVCLQQNKQTKKNEGVSFSFSAVLPQLTNYFNNFFFFFSCKIIAWVVKNLESAMKPWESLTARHLHATSLWSLICCWGLWFPVVNRSLIRKELVNNTVKVSDLSSSFLLFKVFLQSPEGTRKSTFVKAM